MKSQRELTERHKFLYSRRDFLKHTGGGAASLFFSQLIAQTASGGEASGGDLYNEKYRPQFHFTPQKNWMNDPNGLVYYKGDYHMFFQHNPSGINWGNMTWGHSVSRDLVHWRQLPDAIKPDELGTIFSGSAVVDRHNTSGFQSGKEQVLLAFYTSAGAHAPEKRPFTQSLAYSNDRGMTWRKYKGNPIIKHIAGRNRDPKVIWHEPTKRWIMALYLDGDRFMLLSSENAKDWEQLHDVRVAGSDECPDFFELGVEGETDERRWVFWAANGKYLLGSFDGKKFSPEGGPFSSRVGNFYAAQTWSDIPQEDGRRIQIAWMAGGKFPEMPFNQQMSIPCELTLGSFDEGIRLCRVPVREIKALRKQLYSWKDIVPEPGDDILSDIRGELFEIEVELEPADADEFGFNLRGTSMLYDVNEQKLSCRDKELDVEPVKGRVKLHILVDRTSIEIFANGGRENMFLCFPLDADNKSLSILSRGGRTKIRKLNIWKLKSIWSRA